MWTDPHVIYDIQICVRSNTIAFSEWWENTLTENIWYLDKNDVETIIIKFKFNCDQCFATKQVLLERQFSKCIKQQNHTLNGRLN